MTCDGESYVCKWGGSAQISLAPYCAIALGGQTADSPDSERCDYPGLLFVGRCFALTGIFQA